MWQCHYFLSYFDWRVKIWKFSIVQFAAKCGQKGNMFSGVTKLGNIPLTVLILVYCVLYLLHAPSGKGMYWFSVNYRKSSTFFHLSLIYWSWSSSIGLQETLATFQHEYQLEGSFLLLGSCASAFNVKLQHGNEALPLWIPKTLK